MVKTKAFSFVGYSFKTWFAENKLWFVKNKETIKALVAALLGVLATQFGEWWLISILFGAGGAYLTKLILDGIDFFIGE